MRTTLEDRRRRSARLTIYDPPGWNADPKDTFDPRMSASEQRAWHARHRMTNDSNSPNGTDNDGVPIDFLKLGGDPR